MEQRVVTYPRFTLRMRAIQIDGIILGLLVFMLVLFLAKTSIVLTQTTGYVLLLIILSVEPFLVTFSGASIGQRISGLSVQRKNNSRAPNLLVSYLRFLCKLPLGLLSFFTIFTTKKHQALHDVICNTVVVISNPQRVKPHHVLTERAERDQAYFYPSIIKRTFIILVYWFLNVILFSILSLVVAHVTCSDAGICGVLLQVILMILSLGFWLFILAIFVLGWNSLLFGARRRLKNLS